MKSLKEAVCKVIFASEAHERHYMTLRKRILTDPTEFDDNYREALCYLLALNDDCYNHISDLYDFEERTIRPDGIKKDWQTSTSARTTRLAFNLFTGGCMWCDEGTERLCAVDAIFNSTDAPYFVEAVKVWGYLVF